MAGIGRAAAGRFGCGEYTTPPVGRVTQKIAWYCTRSSVESASGPSTSR
jgi:hypothetical protein